MSSLKSLGIHSEQACERGSCASLSDALVSECFVLYVYGILVAVVVILAEQLPRVRIKLGCTPKLKYKK